MQGHGRLFRGATEKPKPSQRKELEEWEAAAEDGFSAIGLTIEQSQKPYIRDCTDGPSAWKALKDIYEKNSTSNRISLKRRFYSYHHDTTQPITDYINDITSLATQLRAIGLKLEDQEITDVLIYSLSPEYGTIATALMTRSDAEFLTVAEISAALMEEEARRKETGDIPTEQAMMARGNRGRRDVPWKEKKCGNCGRRGHTDDECSNSGGGRAGKVKCYRCDKEGHKAWECPERKPEAAEQTHSNYVIDLPNTCY